MHRPALWLRDIPFARAFQSIGRCFAQPNFTGRGASSNFQRAAGNSNRATRLAGDKAPPSPERVLIYPSGCGFKASAEFAAKHEVMIENDQDSGGAKVQFIRFPGYPFEAQKLLGELRNRLEMENGRAMGFEELAEIMGSPKSTAHYWFSIYGHPHLMGFMALVERLSPQARQAFFEAHCRQFPTISDPALAGANRCLTSLLSQKTGLTVITGASNRERSLVLAALGHSSRRSGTRFPVTGMDLHRPSEFVPVLGVRYVDDRLKLNQVREVVRSAWPKFLTTNAQLVLLNGIWSAAPEIGDDLIRLAALRNVVLAEEPALATSIQTSLKHFPIRILTISNADPAQNGVRIRCRAG